jgi:hypothetical protein
LTTIEFWRSIRKGLKKWEYLAEHLIEAKTIEEFAEAFQGKTLGE